MHFIKLFAAGHAYIFVDSESAVSELDSEAIKNICDRVCGAGASGIFAVCQNENKKAQIRAFSENGEIMRDSSTTAICAGLGLKITKCVTACEFKCEKSSYFTYSGDTENNKYPVSCNIGKCSLLLNDSGVERRTELGNRILTLTAVRSTADYAVHFSECMHSLNREYLSEKTSALSLFGGNTSLILCEENRNGGFDMLPLYENGKNVVPPIGGFAAVGVAACLSKRNEFRQEILVDCNGYGVYVIVDKDLSVTVHLDAGVAFEGNI